MISSKILKRFLIFASIASMLLATDTAFAIRKGYNVYHKAGQRSTIFTNTRNYRFSYTGRSHKRYRQVSYRRGGRIRYAWVHRGALTSFDYRQAKRSSTRASRAINKVKMDIPASYQLNDGYRLRTGPTKAAGVDHRKKASEYELTGYQSENGDWLEVKCAGCSSPRWIHNNSLKAISAPVQLSQSTSSSNDNISLDQTDATLSGGGEATSPGGQTLPEPAIESPPLPVAHPLTEKERLTIQKKNEVQRKKEEKKRARKSSRSAAHLTRVCKRVLKKWRGKNWRETKRYCYRGVKKCLKAAGWVPDYMPGRFARDAGKHLLKRGFRKIKTLNPYKAPAGAVIVYKHRSKPSHPGHIDFKGTDDKFYSDFQQRGPGTTWGRKVIGIYVK